MATGALARLLSKHAQEILEKLIDEGLHFYLQCDISRVSFDPVLPPHLTSNFRPLIDFVLAGYTFESLQLLEGELCFEAGFGKENIGSLVTVPFDSIVQIVLPAGERGADACLFINTLALLPVEEETNEAASPTSEDDLLLSSREAILSNPQNQFLKN